MALKDLGGVAAMAATLPKELQAAQMRGVRGVALHVTKAIRIEIRTATGGDMRMSGVGRKGARVGAKFDVKGAINPTAIIFATGPMHFLEHDTGPHAITPRRVGSRGWGRLDAEARAKRKRGRRTGAAALAWGGGNFAAEVRHPGTRAKKPFEKGYLKSRDEAGKIMDREIHAAIARVLR